MANYISGKNITAAKTIDELLSYYDEQFVRCAYLTLLGRKSDPEGTQYYLGRLRAGYGKAKVITQLAESSEAKTFRADLAGLRELIVAQKKADHWFWGFFSRGSRIERQANLLEYELGQIAQQVQQARVESLVHIDRINETLRTNMIPIQASHQDKNKNPAPNFKPFTYNNVNKETANKPRLALDMYVLEQGLKTGIYRVCDELFRRLAQSQKFDLRYFRRNYCKDDLEYLNINQLPGCLHSAEEHEPSGDADIFLSPFGVAPNAWRNDPKVLHAHIIYDLIAIRRPDFFSLEASTEVNSIIASLNKDSVIFAISEYTKKDLLHFRPDLMPSQITVIPLAAGNNFKPCKDKLKKSEVRQRYGIPLKVPYVLSLATLEIRKNLDQVVKSFVCHLEQHGESNLHLVLSGMKGWKLDKLEQTLADAGDWRNRIILTGFVADEDLSALYSDSLCFIYLSRYEGFGLPPLEAMACGTPVICSNNSSLPEVVGQAGLMFDADDIHGVAQAIQKIISSDQYRLSLSEMGLERAGLFNWDQCAKIVADTLSNRYDQHKKEVIQAGQNTYCEQQNTHNNDLTASYMGYENGGRGPVFSRLPVNQDKSHQPSWPIWSNTLPVCSDTGSRRLEGGLRMKGIFKTGTPLQPLITYVTIVRNNAATLERTIISVQEQTYPRVEHIILDGASTDGTLDIILRHGDQLDYFASEPDLGLYDALNKVVPLARGELICVINSDDWLEPNAAEIAAKHMSGAPINALLLTSARVSVEDVIHEWPPAFVHPGSYFSCANDCHNAIYATRLAYEKSGPYDSSYKIAADFKWIMSCMESGAVFVYTNEITANYSLGGTSGDFLQHSLECMKVVQERFTFLTPSEVRGLYHSFFIFSNESNAYEIDRPANYSQFLREVFARHISHPDFLNSLGWASIVKLDHPVDHQQATPDVTMIPSLIEKLPVVTINQNQVAQYQRDSALKIAYVDHSFHRKTLSTDFLPEILRRHGHVVNYFWDNTWNGGEPVNWQDVQAYDVVIMFQAFCPIGNQYYRQLHQNVVFIPMLDSYGAWQGPLFNLTSYWEPFQGSKVLNFSNAIHSMTIGFGIKSHFVRYYQSAQVESTVPKSGLHGFFWLRREDQISWNTIKLLIADTRFDSFHIHLANDPGSPEPKLPTTADIKRHNITTSKWFENKADINKVLDRTNVFFAPRMEEGIGQSFLEAFTRGQCVVAPNEGTMNEYIIHGVNGLLYNAQSPKPLDFAGVNELALKGREGARIGRTLWEQGESDLVKYIVTPSDMLYTGKYQHNFAN